MAKVKFNRRTSDAVIRETLSDIHGRLKSGQRVTTREIKDILSVTIDSRLRAELDQRLTKTN